MLRAKTNGCMRNRACGASSRITSLRVISGDVSSVDLISAAEEVGKLNLDRNSYQKSVDALGEEDRDFDFMGEDLQREIFRALKVTMM